MPICKNCRDAAAIQVEAVRDGAGPAGHSPEICLDNSRTEADVALHGRSCPCQHRPVGTVTREDTP